MTTVRTYLLAPNFQYKPSGPIQIGNIIADPFRPTQSLSTIPADNLPEIDTVTEYNHTVSQQKALTLRTGGWAQFLQVISADVRAESTSDTLREFSINELETRYLRREPTDDDPELAPRLAEPPVQAAIRAGLFGKQPVYLISGVKIAKGLRVRSENRKSLGGDVEGRVPISESISLGAGVGGRSHDENLAAFQTEESVVFAYQLHVLRVKGRAKSIKSNVFESEAAFLHDGDGNEGQGIAVTVAGAEELRAFDDVGVTVGRHDLIDSDGSPCVCITVSATP